MNLVLKSLLVAVPAALGFHSAPVAASSSSAKVERAFEIGITRVIQSRVLNEQRTIHVYLPQSYRQSRGYRRYPVLYVRDGGKFFHSFTGAVQQLTSDATPHAPEMIVVAIGETDRVRDSSSTRSLKGFTGKVEEGFKTSGGGESFASFLEQELLPYIDQQFSTSSYRIYCGYSFTGLGVLDAFFDQSTAFDAFLIVDPSWWWDDYVMERRAATSLPERRFNRTRLFIAASGESYPKNYFIDARDVGSLAEMLQRTNPAGLEWRFERYADESHHSMPLRALYDGLSYIFSGYRPSLDELYNEPEKLRARYAALSDTLGERFSLREDLLKFFGYQFLRELDQPGRAVRYFEMAADAYPGSSGAWDDLGKAYEALGDKNKARQAYERSLNVNPQNEHAREMLNALRGE